MGACSCAVKMDFPKQHRKLEPGQFQSGHVAQGGGARDFSLQRGDSVPRGASERMLRMSWHPHSVSHVAPQKTALSGNEGQAA